MSIRVWLYLFKMIPDELKKMFGLKDAKDVSMANNIWKMLDEMAESDPDQYKNFVQKNVKEGMADATKKQEEKQKPYRITPKVGFSLNMTATLNEKPLESDLNEQVLITKQPWSSVKSKFQNSIKMTLNVTFSDRIKELTSRTTKKSIEKFTIQNLKDIQFFYYSFQGPQSNNQEENQFDFCMILNERFFSDLMDQNGGKKILMGLCVSYFQERIASDKNPLLRHYNPNEFRRLAFYNIDKYSIQISQKKFKWKDHSQPIDFLIEKEVDKKRQNEQKKEKQKEEVNKKHQKNQIIFKEPLKQETEPEIKLSSDIPQPNKKILIEVLKEEQTEQNNEISYTMKQTDSGYDFQFLLPGVTSIKEVELQMKSDCIQLKSKNKKDLKIHLKRQINEESIKAKFKKGQNMLRVSAKYK